MWIAFHMVKKSNLVEQGESGQFLSTQLANVGGEGLHGKIKRLYCSSENNLIKQ